MTKATTQPAVRAEGRSPRRALHPGGGSRRACGASASGVEDRDEPAAQGRPGWRIETSLRRKAVRGGGSRRACGAPVCLRQEGAAGAGGASEPSSTSIPIEGVTLLPFRSHSDHVSRLGPTADLREPSHAGRRPPHNFWRRFQKAFVRWGATATSFGISPFNAVRCVVPALYWEGMARSCSSRDLSDLSIACSVAAAARFGRESEAGREGIIC